MDYDLKYSIKKGRDQNVQNPSDVDLTLPAIIATAIQLDFLKLNSYKQTSSE